ncbi:hypothetical protein RD110_18800 [Rhodoferax koreense]|uniref:Uncharacterized protein n=1 Tax=Rhodoferax koreensis TaxID=1842727 RepID=A0A1P8JZ26_9BURK|nr:hypothetical protein RD110_18800 [Rhodoferax koreense]
MGKIIFKAGNPPHIGWWLTKRRSSTFDFWRWWDGMHWGGPSMPTDTAELAAEWARYPTPVKTILWSDYYPPGARVARRAP